jgi:hypothetical protein
VSLKKDFICPACEGRQVWRIERLLTVGDMGQENPLPVATIGSTWRGYKPHGYFEAFICKGCGHTELYADGIKDLQPDPKRGIHLIDNEPKPEGPMR